MKSKVYFTKEITPESLIKVYEALGKKLDGKVAVKISTGEPGGHNFLQPALISSLVQKLNGTIVECGTAYEGGRYDPKVHYETIKKHGFADIAPCDILDEEDEIRLEVLGGYHLPYNIVGARIDNYDSILMLSHFKGHIMAGFGGALKNMSIGLASGHGKAFIHSVGTTSVPSEMMDGLMSFNQNDFLESMADACKSVIDYVGEENIVYVNVANRLSVDCDCDAHPAEPEMGDIGIFASTDPVAVDQACYDAVINSPDPGKASLVKRMNDKNGIHIVEASEKLGLGSREYELIEI